MEKQACSTVDTARRQLSVRMLDRVDYRTVECLRCGQIRLELLSLVLFGASEDPREQFPCLLGRGRSDRFLLCNLP